jgi:hypothetical protein
MNQLQSAVALFLMSVPLFAAAQDKVDVPVNTVNTIWVIVFVVLFVVSCVGFFAYIWMKDDKSKQVASDK